MPSRGFLHAPNVGGKIGRPSASEHGAIVSTVANIRNPRGIPSGNAMPGLPDLQAVVVQVRNDTGEAIKAGDPVVIKRSIIADADDDNRSIFRRCVLVTGPWSRAAGNSGSWGIALNRIEPASGGRSYVGDVLLSGVCAVKVTKLEGDDNKVDLGSFCAQDEEGTERKLYTSAAGCASILHIPEDAEVGEEYDAIIQVHGFRVVEPRCKAKLVTKLRRSGEFSTAEARVLVADLTADDPPQASNYGTVTCTRRVTPRTIKVYGHQIPNTREAPADATGWFDVEPYSGRWIMTSLDGCLGTV